MRVFRERRGATRFAFRRLAVTAALSLIGPSLYSTANALPPALAGVTTVTASSPTLMNVRLPADAAIWITHSLESPDVEIEGAGRFYGFALNRTIPGANVELLYGMMVGNCWEPGCVPGSPARGPHQNVSSDSPVTATTPEGRLHTLPAGDYVLHMMTDGAPVTARITFRGLTGSATLAPQTPAPYEIKNAVPTLLSPGMQQYYSAGAAGTISTSKGLLFHSNMLDTGPYFGHTSGMCYYLDRGAFFGHFLPGCPAGESGNIVSGQSESLQGGRGINWGSVRVLVGGEWTQGAFDLTYSASATRHLALGWLSLS